GISKFDVNYNKWTNFDTMLSSKSVLPSLGGTRSVLPLLGGTRNVIKALSIGEYIWFVTDSGIVRYDKKLTSWKTYSKADGIVSYLVNDIIVDGDNLWLATQEGISSYDVVSDSWSEGTIYNEMLPSKNVASLAIDGDVIWFSTDKGISSYDKNTGIWRHFTSQNGLLDDFGQGVVISGFVFAVTEKGVNIYDKKTQDWDNYKFPVESAKKSGKEKGFRIDEKGIGFDTSKETQFRLSGISSLEFDDSSKLKPERQDDYQWDTKNDLTLRGTFPNNRSLTGFYSDIIEDNVEYGLTYRGNDKDILFVANGGKFDAKMRNSDLIKDVNLLGADAHLRQSFDHTRLNLQPRYGERIGYYESDFFQYKTGTSIYQLKHTDIVPETETIIADMEVLQRGIDYIVIYPNGWLMFPQEELLEDGENIEVQYQYKPKKEIEKTRVALLTTGVEMGNNHYAGLDVLHEDNLDVVSINADSKDVGLGALSMKIKPEIAYSRNDNDSNYGDGIGSKAEIVATIPRTQLKLDYEGYSDDFRTQDGRETKFGKLEQHLGAYSRFDFAQWLPLTLRFQQERSNDNSSDITDQDAKANIVLSKQNYPTISLTGKKKSNKSDSKEQQQTSVRTDFQYNLPASLLSYVKVRKLEINSYYRESNQKSEVDNDKSKDRTGYLKLNFSPIERFDLSASYKTNKSLDKESNNEFYQLQDKLQRILIRSNFASLKVVILDFHFDDLQSRNKSADSDLKSASTYLTTGMNLVPGIWASKLRMITLSTRYSSLEQTVPKDNETADSNSRALRLQLNLTPYNWVVYTGTYDGVKSWISHPQFDPAKYNHKYRNEVEIKANSISRILLEYDQENENEGVTKKRSYSPSLFYETKFTDNWILKLRNMYYAYTINENDKTTEKGTTVTPSLSFRYMNNELSHNGRIYVTNMFSLSVDRSERNMKEYASETYTVSSSLEWRFTRNLSSRIRVSISYKDNHTESDEALADIYIRLTARF
ncbi:MAG: hypothetical protein QG588_2233, partial [Candidatus Poribacteria bacterium]|nr:hypothetical protein [Candidatus Poribacteria bacterium]